jgi:hypothetical protein
MTIPTEKLPPVSHGPAKNRSKWRRRIGVAGAVLIALVVGGAIGAAGSSQQSLLKSDQATINTEHTKIGQLHGQLGMLQGKTSALQSRLASETNMANHALAAATAKVKAADAAKQAQLNQEAASMKSQQKTLDTEVGNVQANQISASGVYVVGRDVKSGTWHTNGDGGQTDSECYFATLNSDNTQDISDNNNFDGAETVNLSGVYAFNISGPCTWVLVP